MHTLATAAASSRAPSKPDTPLGPTPDAELRAERAEQQVADLKAALENIKSERDRWRTIAERRSLPPAEDTLRVGATRCFKKHKQGCVTLLP
jgi:hypothetical protein